MNRWTLKPEGGILWRSGSVGDAAWSDHLEMSGTQVSQYVRYGVNEDGCLILSQVVVYPRLRCIPNNTHASTYVPYEDELYQTVLLEGTPVERERPYEITFDGILTIKSQADRGLEIHRILFPARGRGAVVQLITLVNAGNSTLSAEVTPFAQQRLGRGCYGVYLLDAVTGGTGASTLHPGESRTTAFCCTGRKLQDAPVKVDDPVNMLEERRQFIAQINHSLELETPEPVLNQAFAFAKLRAAESVFENRCGLLHSPGGLSYYAAVWTNDQVEYAGPFFPLLGDKNAVEASLNAYRLFIPFMGPDYHAIPSSIIAEGNDIWEGAGDRGDAAMYAYGASLFVMALGNELVARELWPAIQWCLEYCRRQLTPQGVVASDSDELEGRFSTGKANLSTSALAYGGLVAAARLGRTLGYHAEAEAYNSQAEALEQAIENYFGAKVEGFETYRYHEDNPMLRSWICLPLTVGILGRARETIDALLSHSLWTEDGLKTQSGETTYWDRSTLYGLRGIFAAGEREKALGHLRSYSQRRTLGEHVPYAVEAFPEGNQRHLSGESALYCKVYTEGILGLTPTGLHSFLIKPQLPEEWPGVSLKRLCLCGTQLDLTVNRNSNTYEIVLIRGQQTRQYHCAQGEAVEIVLS